MRSFPILELLQNSCDPPLNPESLEELELALGVRFPKDYADFLLAFNGGNFVRDVTFSVPDPTQWVKEVSLVEFYGEPEDGIEQGGLVHHARLVYRSPSSGVLADRPLQQSGSRAVRADE